MRLYIKEYEMKKKRIIQLMLILGILGFCLGNPAVALTLVTSPPPGDAWSEHNSSSPCTHTYYTINTASYTDFSEGEKEADYYNFASTFGSHADPIAYTSTWTFNCHSYIFLNQSGWLNDPSNFLGTVYHLDDCGSVYRFAGHTANSGAWGYPYYAKCGQGPYAYHDTYLYGTHYQRWQAN
jgi:hypothetical protein